MINRKRTKYVNTNKLFRKKCYNKSLNLTKQHNINKKKNIFKKLIYLMLVFPTITFLSYYLFLKIPINKVQTVYIYNNYYIGQKVILKNDIEYYCIDNCSSESRMFKLLKVDPVDINNDLKIDDNDKIEFDLSKNNMYDVSNKNNIGFYLDGLNKTENLDHTESFRLLTSEEYINIRDKMNFGYDWDDGNWLANKYLDSWWLETPIVKSVYAVTSRGTYKLSSPSDKNYVRPVVITFKDNVK